MKTSLGAIMVTILIMMASCENSALHKLHNENSADVTAEEQSFNAADSMAQSPPQDPVSTQGRAKQKSSATAGTQQDWDKKIIKTAHLEIEVKDFDAFTDQLRNTVKQTGAYIANEQLHKEEGRIGNVVTIKVPVMVFDEAVSLLSEREKLITKRVVAQDVTGEVFDTKSRLEAKRDIRQRYIDLLSRANKMEDILKVQGEINSIHEEMEAAAGRIAYLSHASAFSTIELSYFQLIPITEPIEDSPAFFESVKDAFLAGAHWFSRLILACITIWPVWVLIAASVLIFKKRKQQKVKSISP